MLYVDSSHCRYCNYPNEGEYLCDPACGNICDPCRKLFELEQKVKEIRAMLVGLESERQQVKEKANHHHDKLIHRLPPEISAKIFELCIPNDLLQRNLLDAPRFALCAPLVISAVCRTWRAIAHSSPTLWTALIVVAGRTKTPPDISLVRRWIERAGQLPLSIILHAHSEHSSNLLNFYDSNKTVIRILEVLKLHSDRWIHLRLEGTTKLLSYLPDDMHYLQELRALHLAMVDRTCRTAITPIRIYPKQLNVLSLNRVMLYAVDLDWGHLTDLTMDFVTAAESFVALSRAPNLITCQLLWDTGRYSDGPIYAFDLPPNFVHFKLQNLRVGVAHCDEIFEHLSCPSLTSLTIDAAFFNQVALPEALVDFLKSSGCSLESLEVLDGIFISHSNMSSICHEITTLQRLSMRSRSVPGIFYEHLAEFSVTGGRSTPRYLPSLRSLCIEQDTFDDMIINIFGMSTSSPIEWHRHALQEVTVITSRIPELESDIINRVGEETMQKILQLREAGVKWKVQFRDVAGREVDAIEFAMKRNLL